MASSACVTGCKTFVKIAKRPAEDPNRRLQSVTMGPYYVNMPGGGRSLASLRRSLSLQDNISHYVVMTARPRSVPEKNVRSSSSSNSSPSLSRSTKGQLNSPSQQRPLPELPSPLVKTPPKPVKLSGDSVEQAYWFFQVDRKLANELLRECGVDGCFMIRNSSKEDAAFTLSVMHKGRLYHIQVRKRADNLYALGKAKKNEQAFNTVEGLVAFYGKEPLKLYTNGKPSGETLLKTAPRRVDI